jgi:hypothetical protein
LNTRRQFPSEGKKEVPGLWFFLRSAVTAATNTPFNSLMLMGRDRNVKRQVRKRSEKVRQREINC